MGVRLTVKLKSEAGAGDEAKIVTLEDELINLGRDQSCQVVLAQKAVSRNHARISRDGALFFVEDLGSSYGTHLNGARLPKGEKRLLRNGDVIAIAQFDVTFDRVNELSEAISGQTQLAARRAVRSVMKGLGAGDNSYLRVMSGDKEGQHIELAEGQEYVFGRDRASADVVLTDDLVSRRHAKIRRDWSGVTLEDLQSRNGVKLNHKRVTRATLKDRDEIEIGGVRLLFVDPTEAREESLAMPSIEGAAPTLGLEEEISVRDLRSILQAIADQGQVEADSVMLTEHVRSALKRQVSFKYARGTNTLVVYLLDPQIEDAIRSSIKRTSAGTHLALEPEIAQDIVRAVKGECSSLPPTAQRPVILTAMDIRRYVRKLLEYEFNPPFSVVSYQELSPELNIQPVARISTR